jgi:hypothetical protein
MFLWTDNPRLKSRDEVARLCENLRFRITDDRYNWKISNDFSVTVKRTLCRKCRDEAPVESVDFRADEFLGLTPDELIEWNTRNHSFSI